MKRNELAIFLLYWICTEKLFIKFISYFYWINFTFLYSIRLYSYTQYLSIFISTFIVYYLIYREIHFYELITLFHNLQIINYQLNNVNFIRINGHVNFIRINRNVNFKNQWRYHSEYESNIIITVHNNQKPLFKIDNWP